MQVLSRSRSKAQTLLFLKAHIGSARVLPLSILTYKDWKQNNFLLPLNALADTGISFPVVVRSSAVYEDSDTVSNAGAYLSILDIQKPEDLDTAIGKVFASYPDQNDDHEVFIQPQLNDVKISGVIFTKDPNTGSDYVIINYDDTSHKTNTITSGESNALECYIHHKESKRPIDPFFKNCLDLAQELETLLGKDHLDIEFAVTEKNEFVLFQARPLVCKKTTISPTLQHEALLRISKKIEALSQKHPYLHGDKGIYGVMPDWNPAEIIGIRPKPLDFSLYRELVTDSVWAYQRNNYGYLNLRSFPLLIDFEGLPYVDVRVSLNSFIPKNLDPKLASKLVNYYINKLSTNPHLHDKVEFEIVFSCYSFDLKQRLKDLEKHGFTQAEKHSLFDALNALTQSIVLKETALWKKDLEKINTLQKRQAILVEDPSLDPISKIYWLIEDCKRYGILPFAGLARVGFIAVEILRSLVGQGIFTQKDYDQFFNSLKTVSSEIDLDFAKLDKESFLKKYGHLRPGTYNIQSPSYEENPDSYFDWTEQLTKDKKTSSFELSLPQLREIQNLLNEDGWSVNVLEFLEFIKKAIESREYAKFIFSKSVHHTLLLIKSLASDYGFSIEDSSYLDIQDILRLYSRSQDPKKMFERSIQTGKEQHAITKVLNLPPLIFDSQTPFSFSQVLIAPNYITQKSVEGFIAIDIQNSDLDGKIIFIPSADPGYDWLFLKKIGGLITMYGGINSHMAIRANELGIPAIIGAGEILYRKWSKAHILMIDCQNRQVKILK